MIKLVFDCETTGLTLPSTADIDKQPHVIELAVAVVDRGEIISEHSWLINPGMEITEKITKITGISNDMLMGMPSFKDLLPEIREVFARGDELYAHNAPFDVACLTYELKRAECNDFPWPKEVICTVQEHLHLFGHRPKLTDLYAKIVGTPLDQSHRALGDVRALVEILKKENLL